VKLLLSLIRRGWVRYGVRVVGYLLLKKQLKITIAN
jgi:hypothetical protein